MRVPKKQPYRLACSMQPVLVLWLCWCLILTAARVARIRRAISSLMLRHVCWATRSPMLCDTALPCTDETQPCGSEPRTA